jgi:hypothetical protein
MVDDPAAQSGAGPMQNLTDIQAMKVRDYPAYPVVLMFAFRPDGLSNPVGWNEIDKQNRCSGGMPDSGMQS